MAISYPPLKLIKEITDLYPDAWADMEDFHMANGKDGLPSWEPWCYAPIAAAISVASNGADNLNYDIISDAQKIAALAPWRKKKVVYHIDRDLENMLRLQETDDLQRIPDAVLMQLPELAIYIEFEEFARAGIAGMFVHLEHDVNNGDRELRLLLLFDTLQVMAIPIHLDGKNLLENYDHTRFEAGQNVIEMFQNYEMGRYFNIVLGQKDVSKEYNKMVSFLVNVVLYVIAENKDIQKNKMQESIYKETDRVKDKYSEIIRWDLGYRIGDQIRKTPQDVKAHVRKAHWHHYWTGPRNTPDRRKLILKWVAPTFVNWDKTT